MVLISLVSVLNLLYFYISTFRSMCAVPKKAVFCSNLTSWFSGMLFTYFLNVFQIVPVAPIITGITIVFTFHMRCISILRSLHFRIFSEWTQRDICYGHVKRMDPMRLPKIMIDWKPEEEKNGAFPEERGKMGYI